MPEIEKRLLEPRIQANEIQLIREEIDCYERAAAYLNACTWGVPKLQLSVGLSLAARDLVCSLGGVGLIAPTCEGERVKMTGNPKEAACFKYIGKYGQIREDSLVYEHFVYRTDDPMTAVATIMSAHKTVLHGSRHCVLDERLRVFGCASGFHKSQQRCTVLIYMNVYFESRVVALDRQPSNKRPVAALYTPIKLTTKDGEYVS